MNKKSILIVSSSLTTGGLEKCIINLCDNLDYNEYDVDLYLFNDGRDLLPSLNKNVNVLPDSPYYSLVYNQPLGQSCKKLFSLKKYSLLLYRFVRTIRSKLKLNLNTKYDWKRVKKTMLHISKHYDAAIGFEEGSSNYYVAECIDATVKSCWIHTDLKAINTNKQLDNIAFQKADYICTVGKNTAKSIKELYPQHSNKVRIFSLPSLYDTKHIFELAKEDAGFDKSFFNIVSVGRLVELKGFQICAEACRKLLDEGYKTRWYIIGEGEYRKTLEKLISEYEISDYFFLVGNTDNPYKYIKSADVCVQMSSYEGYGLVVFEEKILKKAVILSNIPSFTEMITNGVNGLIVERNSNKLFKAVIRLLTKEIDISFLENEHINNYISQKETLNDIYKTLNNEKN